MPLTKIKLADAIERVECPNTDLQYGVLDVRGVNNSKKFIRTKANINNRDLSKFQIVFPHCFVFNHRTSRNGSKFSIAYNDTESAVICTEDYVVFRVKETYADIVAPEWLYLYFNRSEFDRYVITNSWGSSTEFYNWEDICALEMDLPPLPIQKKYIAVYKAIQDDLKVHIQSSAYLRTVFRVYLEKIKQTAEKVSLQSHIELCSERNGEALGLDSVRGVSIQKKFIYTKADMGNVSLKSYYVVKPNEFCYVPITSRNGDKISLAINDSQENYLVSSTYVVFRVKDTKKLNPKYLFLWLSTSEFDRYARFNSWGSAREAFDWAALESLEIPMPDIAIQNGIVGLLEAQRKEEKAFEKTTDVVSGICSILIAGALKEGAKS
ncbi:MAG: restriction endonuclease subunit S [Subdoligranulum sp.]